MINAEQLARQFHENYERLAPEFGYSTRKESAKPWEEVPLKNRRLMIAVCAAILDNVENAVLAKLKAVITDHQNVAGNLQRSEPVIETVHLRELIAGR